VRSFGKRRKRGSPRRGTRGKTSAAPMLRRRMEERKTTSASKRSSHPGRIGRRHQARRARADPDDRQPRTRANGSAGWCSHCSSSSSRYRRCCSCWSTGAPNSRSGLDADQTDRHHPRSTAHGDRQSPFHRRKSDAGALSDVPQPVRDAVLSAEDRNFYSNPGYSTSGFLRAARDNVLGREDRGGWFHITQQYVKNAFLGSERHPHQEDA